MSRSNQLAGLITATPTSTLDTINEINTSLNNDNDLSGTLTGLINAKASKSGDTFTGNVIVNQAGNASGVGMRVSNALESSSGIHSHGFSGTFLNTFNNANAHGVAIGSKHADSNSLIVGQHDTAFDHFVVKGGGNVGIGTASPQNHSLLHVKGDMGGEPYSAIVSEETNTSTGYGGFQAKAIKQAHYRYAINGNNKFQTRVGQGVGADIWSVYSWTQSADVIACDGASGNFGIGTTGPNAQLHATGTVALNSGNYWQGASGGSVRLRGGTFETSINNNCTSLKLFPTSTANRIAGRYTTGIGFMHLDPDNSSWGSSYQGMQAWVGLKVVDTPGQERSSLVIATTDGYAAGAMPREVCEFHPTTGAMIKNFTGSYAEGAKFGPSMESGYTSNYSVAIASDDFLIRFANASYTVLGSIRRDGSGILWSSNSDHRLKENVTPLGNALERLSKLSPKRFTWKEYPEMGEVDGFIAHEVDEVVPEAVDGEKDRLRDNGDIWPQGLDMSKLVPLLTASIQELSAKVTALESAS
mgnify:CR=1 FL=1